jgi:fructosamine-3-kinase
MHRASSGTEESSDRLARVAAVVTALHGRDVRVLERTALGGGSINLTELLRTTAGPFVIKSHRNGAAMFAAEAEGLEALRASGTPLTGPRVVHAEAGPRAFLLLEFLEAGPRVPDFDEALGRGLAELHRATGKRFGFAHDNFCGAAAQPNPWTDRWVDFYGASRIGHQLALAVDAGLVSAADRRLVERLVARLGEWIDEPPFPSLIHGDLWSGNLHRDPAGRPALIDPAVYYADREAELGMMTLFGGFPPRVFEAYDEAFPLASNWRERQPLYQLYHLMNHLNLFGGGYHAGVMAIVRQFA